MSNYDMKLEGTSSLGVSKPSKTNQGKQKAVPNQEILEISRQAEKAGFGLSYGKYVQKYGL